jgi:hypothetical protein
MTMVSSSGPQHHMPNLVGESMPQKSGHGEIGTYGPGSDCIQEDADLSARNSERKTPAEDLAGEIPARARDDSSYDDGRQSSRSARNRLVESERLRRGQIAFRPGQVDSGGSEYALSLTDSLAQIRLSHAGQIINVK